MGRKPKPTNVIKLEGNPGKRPIPEEPDVSSDCPAPPDHLHEYAREEWYRMAAGLHTLGLLYQVDRAVFAAYCCAYARWRIAEESLLEEAKLKPGGMPATFKSRSTKGTWRKNPMLEISEKAAADMVKYAAEFGFTPSARARLGTSPGGEGSGKFDGYLGKK